MADISGIYKEREEDFSKQLREVRKSIRLVGTGRLFAFLLTAFLVYYLFGSNTVFIPGILGITIFLILVKKNSQLQAKSKYLQLLVRINGEEIEGLNGHQNAFEDGVEFKDGDHAFAHDLDLFGEGSIFQWLNRTCTAFGKRNLAKSLTTPDLDTTVISERQKAVKELSALLDWRQDFRAIGLGNKKGSVEENGLLAWIQNPSQVATHLFYKIALWVAPIYGLLCIVLFALEYLNLSQYILSLLPPLGLVAFNLKEGKPQLFAAGSFPSHDCDPCQVAPPGGRAKI